MKISTFLLLCIPLCLGILVSCGPDVDTYTKSINVTEKYKLPEEMQHCKVYKLRSRMENNLNVVFCKNTTSTFSTYRCGKNCRRYVQTIWE